ncbi:MAG: hypothetical protein KA885_02495 [Spirochaetes bacterium]|nr:hypothetical protein [Spirochaetota bacterium]
MPSLKRYANMLKNDVDNNLQILDMRFANKRFENIGEAPLDAKELEEIYKELKEFNDNLLTAFANKLGSRSPFYLTWENLEDTKAQTPLSTKNAIIHNLITTASDFSGYHRIAGIVDALTIKENKCPVCLSDNFIKNHCAVCKFNYCYLSYKFTVLSKNGSKELDYINFIRLLKNKEYMNISFTNDTEIRNEYLDSYNIGYDKGFLLIYKKNGALDQQRLYYKTKDSFNFIKTINNLLSKEIKI